MPETRREIEAISRAWTFPNEPQRWGVTYRVWGINGRDLGTWAKYVSSPDEEGAMLKVAAKWAKQDAKNAKRRERAAKKKEQADESRTKAF